MSLISFSEITSKLPSQDDNAAAEVADGEQLFFEGRGHEVIKKIVGTMRKDVSMHYVSDGAFSTHELIEHFVKITGPVKLYLTTWAMSENPLRSILNLVDRKMITELNCLFDVKITDRAPKVFAMANSIVTRVKLVHCHAKIFVIENDEWAIVNNASANMTKNPRMEAGVVCSERRIAELYRNQILKKLAA